MIFKAIRQRLALKLFLTYLIVIVVGATVLASAAEVSIPRSFDRHLAVMSHMMGRSTDGPAIGDDLFGNFRAAVNEALGIASMAAIAVAVLVSVFVSRRIVGPIRQMGLASRRIAEGHYNERVYVPGNPNQDETDELAELALSFNQMAARLENTEERRRQLIGDVAHELRTPLTAIKGYLEGLIDGMIPVEAETLQLIYQEADRMQRLVNDLQELSRVEAGAYQLRIGSHGIHQLVEHVSTRMKRQFEEKGVLLETQVPADLPPVRVDEQRIEQVLTNLVGNALQYTPAGGKVLITARPAQNEIQISIQDTGVGIPAEHLPFVFDRFYRVDKSRSRAGGGSGIGLTIARHLVEAHGGRIWARSAGPGQGSTFSFTLPIAN